MVRAMQGRCYKYAMTILVALLTSPLLAQYSIYDAPPPKWDLYGNAGFDFAHNSLGSHQTGSTSSGSTNQQFGGTIDGTLHGFYSSPEFLDFGANVNDFQNASSDSNNAGNLNVPGFDSRNNALGYSAYANFLAGRGMPIHVHYIKTDAGLTSSLFHTTQGSSEFGVTWRGKLPHTPWLSVDFRDGSSNVAIPTSLLDTNNKLKNLNVNAHDSLWGWKWNGDYTHITEQITTLGVTALPNAEDIGSTNETFNIRRGFFGDLINFSVGEQYNHQKSDGSLGTSDYKLFEYNSSLWYLPSDKLSSGVSFYHDRITNDQFSAPTVDSPFVQVFIPSTTITSLTGTTIYRPRSFVTITGNVTYDDTFVPSVSEQLEKTLTPSLAASVLRTWHAFEFGVHGMAGYRMTTSTLGRQSNGVIDAAGATVSRGNLQRLRYTGKVEYNHDLLPQLIGSYNNSLTGGLQAETMRWGNWRLVAGLDYNQYDTLTIGGRFNNRTVGFHAGATRERFGIRVFRNQNSGDGSIFPTSLSFNNYLINLPVGTLIGS